MKLRVTLGITLMLFLNSVTNLSDSKGISMDVRKSLAEGSLHQHSPELAKSFCAVYNKPVKEKI
ncbi:hypothetical protein [Rufibacter radiotolerans]|uniref:hypothetical protein n=1 Tax=Rufibacter radiotolerans TaxID=1379910 RepID=UPI000B2B9ED7|nr:hypothetical protein [Rufibacter radiotolerans]